MKFFVRILAALTAVMLILCACSCTNGQGNEEQTSVPTLTDAQKIQVAMLNGPTGLALLKLANDKSYMYHTTTVNSPEEIAPLITTGEVDIATCTLNLAANLYNKTNGGVRMLAITTLGVLSIIENGETVKSVADLKGKTLHASGKGATPEYIINYILTQNGLDPAKDVKIEYHATHNELATLAIEGKADICMLPEPFASKVLNKNKSTREALNLTDEWGKVSDVRLAQGCVIARTEFIEQNPNAVVEFLNNTEASVGFLLNNDTVGPSFLFNLGVFPSLEYAQKVLPKCNIVYIRGSEMMRMSQENLGVLYSYDPACVGGALPNEDFYYGVQ